MPQTIFLLQVKNPVLYVTVIFSYQLVAASAFTLPQPNDPLMEG
jgi:hypothetical protein